MKEANEIKSKVCKECVMSGHMNDYSAKIKINIKK